MNAYKNLLKKINEQYKSVPIFAKEMNMSKQLLYYHLSNLKNGKITFKPKQLKEMSSKLQVDINFKKLYVKTFEAEKKLWQLEQAGVFFNKKYELRNTEKNTVKILEKVKNADEADELYGYFSFLEIDNFEIIEYFKIMYFWSGLKL